MTAPLFTLLEGRFPVLAHDHVAAICRGDNAASHFVSFLAEGVKQGDLCQYLAPARLHGSTLELIRKTGVEPGPNLQSGQLRLSSGLADYSALCDWTQDTFAEAERARVPALRWLEDGGWAAAAGLPAERLFEFHALLNYQVKHIPSVAVCHYSLDRIEPDFLFAVVSTHRHLLIEDTLVRDNPFYIPPEKFIPLSPGERRRRLLDLFREVGFDVQKLLASIAAYGRLHSGFKEGSQPAH